MTSHIISKISKIAVNINRKCESNTFTWYPTITSNEAKYKLKTTLNIKALSSYPNKLDSFLGTVTDGTDVPVSQQLKLTRNGWGGEQKTYMIQRFDIKTICILTFSKQDFQIPYLLIT